MEGRSEKNYKQHQDEQRLSQDQLEKAVSVKFKIFPCSKI